MQLLLKVTHSNNKALKQTMQYEFSESGGTIGRKISNSWVLPDENRHLSGSHSKIEYDKGSFYIIDTSTNGVFINGQSSPIGKGNRKKIGEGDQLVMGTYGIQVQIMDDEINVEDSSPPPPLSSDDLFSDLIDDSTDSAESADSVQEEVFETSGFNIQDNQIDDQSVGSDDPFFESGEFSLTDDQVIPTNNKEKNDEVPDLDSFFKPPKVSVRDGSDVFFKDDGAKSKSEKIESEEIPSVIPDDWIKENNDSIDDLLTGIVDPFKAEDENKIEKADEKPEKIITEKTKETGLPIIEVVNAVKDHEKKDINSDLISAFFEGMGLEYQPEDSEFTREDMLLAGGLFRKAVEGTMEVLQSRAEIKNEMRMDMTTIQPIQNNPIKFSITVDEAIKKLLLEKNNSQMNPSKAMDEAYDDIKSHQVAVISGIQASLTYVLKRFEPDNLIERLERQNPISANIPIHRKAKLWEAFEQLYETIESEAEDDFNRLFGQEFAKAYDDQVEKLKKARGSE